MAKFITYKACESTGRGDKLHAVRPDGERTLCGIKVGPLWQMPFSVSDYLSSCDRCVAGVLARDDEGRVA